MNTTKNVFPDRELLNSTILETYKREFQFKKYFSSNRYLINNDNRIELFNLLYNNMCTNTQLNIQECKTADQNYVPLFVIIK